MPTHHPLQVVQFKYDIYIWVMGVHKMGSMDKVLYYNLFNVNLIGGKELFV